MICDALRLDRADIKDGSRTSRIERVDVREKLSYMFWRGIMLQFSILSQNTE